MSTLHLHELLDKPVRINAITYWQRFGDGCDNCTPFQAGRGAVLHTPKGRYAIGEKWDINEQVLQLGPYDNLPDGEYLLLHEDHVGWRLVGSSDNIDDLAARVYRKFALADVHQLVTMLELILEAGESNEGLCTSWGRGCDCSHCQLLQDARTLLAEQRVHLQMEAGQR